MKFALFIALVALVAAQSFVYCAPIPRSATDVVFSQYLRRGAPVRMSYSPKGQNLSDKEKKEAESAAKFHNANNDPKMTGYQASTGFHISGTDGHPHVTGYAQQGPKGNQQYKDKDGNDQTHLYLPTGQQWTQPNTGTTPGKVWTGAPENQQWGAPQGRLP
ncbi:hypothetical protein CBOM_00501 [Ceraceosorus bombacis]|uniref:Uncharacterized protein n=1 Tax=Ceraceosorus bombacis TaxID=401625 RepID=A0A0P1BA82_9BASI|nr:hypothetical protein CBOM_00501 [Ceraceosorus bombacis]